MTHAEASRWIATNQATLTISSGIAYLELNGSCAQRPARSPEHDLPLLVTELQRQLAPYRH